MILPSKPSPPRSRLDRRLAIVVAGLASASAIVAASARAGDPREPQEEPDVRSFATATPDGESILGRLDRELQSLARKVRPAAVEISVRVAPPGALAVPGGPTKASRSRLFVDDSPVYFSGTLIDPRGLVVTAADAVRFPATRISVRLADGTVVNARSLGVATSIEIGLLQIVGAEACLSSFSPEFADSNEVAPGSWVMSVGSPFGLSGTISTGIVSGVNRKLVGSSGDYRSLLQVTSPVNPGDAGSPLADSSGRLVGVMALTYRRGGSVGGKGSWTGAAMLREFRVFCIAREGEVPRDPRNLEDLWGEYLSESFDLPFESPSSAETADEDAVTEGIHFAFPINDVRRAVSEILARSPDVASLTPSVSAPLLLGIRFHPVGAALASQLGLEPSGTGVVIEEVVEGGWAARSGLQRFDVILSIDGRTLRGPEDIGAAAIGLDGTNAVPLKVLRQAREIELKLIPGR